MKKLDNPGRHYLVAVPEQGISRLRKGQPMITGPLLPLETVAEQIRCDPRIARQTESVRNLLARWGRKSKQFERAKLALPSYLPQAEAPPGTPITNMSPQLHNGLYVYDIDEERELMDPEATAELLQRTPGILLVARSASGDALYALAAGPKTDDDAVRRDFWEAIKNELPAETQRHIATGQSGLSRMRIIAADPNLWLATSVCPLKPEIPEPPPATQTAAPTVETEFQKRRRLRREMRVKLGIGRTYRRQDAPAARERERIREALAAIPPSHADVYQNWISIAYALAAGEHKHGPEFQGKELFLEYSLRNAKYQPGDENRFDDAYRRWSGKTGLGKIVNIAKSYGWNPKSSARHQQIKDARK